MIDYCTRYSVRSSIKYLATLNMEAIVNEDSSHSRAKGNAAGEDGETAVLLPEFGGLPPYVTFNFAPRAATATTTFPRRAVCDL